MIFLLQNMDFAPVWCRVRFEPSHFLTISGVRNFTQDFFLCDETKKRGARLALLWLQGVCCFSRSGCQSPFFHTAPSIGGLFQTSFQTPPRSAYLTSLQKWNHFPFEKSPFLDWFSIIWRRVEVEELSGELYDKFCSQMKSFALGFIKFATQSNVAKMFSYNTKNKSKNFKQNPII